MQRGGGVWGAEGGGEVLRRDVIYWPSRSRINSEKISREPYKQDEWRWWNHVQHGNRLWVAMLKENKKPFRNISVSV